MGRIRLRVRLAIVLGIVGAALVFTATAAAISVVYYFGSMSNPVRISNGTAGSQTSGVDYRQWNEATAKSSGCGVPCGKMNVVTLFYNTTQIGYSTNTFYFGVFQRSATYVRSGCQISSSGWPAYAFCDTSKQQ